MKLLKLDTNKKFKHYGEKIKQISFHSEKPLLLGAHYNGKLSIFDYESQKVVKEIEVCGKPVRTAIWLPDDQILTGSDDLMIRIFNFHTTQKITEFQAHKDFIRKAIYDQRTKEIITCSDDKTICVWNLRGQNYEKNKQYNEHSHFVMDVKWNPKEDFVFVSASLDSTIKIWNTKSDNSNGTLTGHKKGVNCVSFCQGERSLLISGSDDLTVIVWDLTARAIIRVLENHQGNVIDVCFMDKLPLFCSIAEDGKLNFYGLKNFQFQFDQVNFMNKGWSLDSKKNLIAAGYDEGCVVVNVGNDKPLHSCSKGKLVYAQNSEIYLSNLKAVMTKEIENFEHVNFNSKELGILDFFPKKIKHNHNGQLIAFTDGYEYAIYKSISFKLVLFGDAKDFIWGKNNLFALLDKMNEVVLTQTTGEVYKTLKFDFYVTKIFPGKFLGIASSEFILFYDWDGEKCIGKIDAEPIDLYWNENQFVLKDINSMYLLEYNEENQQQENTFELLVEIEDKMKNGFWLENLFFYTDESNKFKMIINEKRMLITTIQDNSLLVDYLKNHQMFFFFDQQKNLTSFKFSQNLLKCLQQNQNNLDNVLNCYQKLNSSEQDFLAKILTLFERQDLAYQVVSNKATKFEFAINLKKLDDASQLCEELKDSIYWKKLGDLAIISGKFDIAQKSFKSCADVNSLMLLASCTGNKQLMEECAQIAMNQNHMSVAFQAYMSIRQLDKCLEILLQEKKYSQAAIFAKNYCPSKISYVVQNWKSNCNQYLSNRIADPMEFQEQFKDIPLLIEIEKVLQQFLQQEIKADKYEEYQQKIQDINVYQYAIDHGVEQLEVYLQEFNNTLNQQLQQFQLYKSNYIYNSHFDKCSIPIIIFQSSQNNNFKFIIFNIILITYLNIVNQNRISILRSYCNKKKITINCFKVY